MGAVRIVAAPDKFRGTAHAADVAAAIADAAEGHGLHCDLVPLADGGEVIIYAPHLTEVSITHGHLIDEVGYHVRDFFVKQPERFRHIPGGILAHSTHVRGAGDYDAETDSERPRIRVTLATSIPEERCRRINLGYLDYRTINPQEWAGREAEGILLVEHAGEVLYRLATEPAPPRPADESAEEAR